MTLDTARFDLPPILKVEECQTLHAFLQHADGQPVTLDCARVTRLGGLAAQLIQMAATSWAAKNLPFTLAAPSDDFRNCLAILGMDSLLSESEGAA